MKLERVTDVTNNKGYGELIGAALLIGTLFIFLKIGYRLSGHFDKLSSTSSYLAWHSLFEFGVILVSFAIFIVAYFTYDQTRNLRTIFFGNMFLTFGLIEMFHTFTFKGMPDFFVKNDGANRATTFWIVTVIIQSLGFFVAGFIPPEKKSKLDRRIFLIPVVLICVPFFVVIMYYPDILPFMYVEGKGLTEIKIKLEMLVIFLLIVSFVKYLQEYIRRRDNLTFLLMLSLILCVFSEIAFTQYFNVYDIYNYMGHVYRIIAFFIVFRVMFITSVQKPYFDLARAKNKIKDYADNLDKIVEQRTGELTQINQKLLDDLEYARELQKSMLPSVLPEVDEVSFYPKYLAAEKLGGDYYNIFKINHDNIALCIGDVSGHGVSAAMLTVFLNHSIHAVNEELNGDRLKINAPSQVLKNIFNAFNKANFKDEVYIVFFYAVLDINKMELTYSSAGFNVVPLILRNDSTVEIEIRGFPICKIAEIIEVEYEDRTIKLQKGDNIVLCTDGLIEAEDDKKRQYTYERLKKVLSGLGGKSCSEIADCLEKDVFGFTGNRPVKDDITLMVMEINR